MDDRVLGSACAICGKDDLMQLDGCNLEGIDAVSLAPFERNAPEEEWVNAANDGAIRVARQN
jgi:hypothetical protein